MLNLWRIAGFGWMCAGCAFIETLDPFNPTSSNTDTGLRLPSNVPERPSGVTDQLVVGSLEMDILFVVDVSCGYNEQYDIATAAPALLDTLSNGGVDYRIAVATSDTSTSERAGRLEEHEGAYWSHPRADDPVDLFQALVVVEEPDSDPVERILDGVYAALEGRGDDVNQSFRRPGAALHTAVMSEDPDQSNLTPQEFVTWYRTLPARGAPYSFSAIVPDDLEDSEPSAYTVAVEALGGLRTDYRDAPYDAFMTELGQLWTRPYREVVLSRIPQPDTLRVSIRVPLEDGTETVETLHEGWVYDGIRNAVEVQERFIEPLSTVEVHYEPDEG